MLEIFHKLTDKQEDAGAQVQFCQCGVYQGLTISRWRCCTKLALSAVTVIKQLFK